MCGRTAVWGRKSESAEYTAAVAFERLIATTSRTRIGCCSTTEHIPRLVTGRRGKSGDADANRVDTVVLATEFGRPSPYGFDLRISGPRSSFWVGSSSQTRAATR
jgi:hypothetical protein